MCSFWDKPTPSFSLGCGPLFILVLCLCVKTILSFIEFVTILLLSYLLLFWPQGMWDLSSPPGIKTCPPHALEGEILTTGPPEKSLGL